MDPSLSLQIVDPVKKRRKAIEKLIEVYKEYKEELRRTPPPGIEEDGEGGYYKNLPQGE